MSVRTAQRNLQWVVGSFESHYIFAVLQCHIAEDRYLQGFLLYIFTLISQMCYFSCFHFQFNGVLKKNYNSVDLSEVEFLDDTNGPRKLSPEVVEVCV
jgi:hypothetical protein